MYAVVKGVEYGNRTRGKKTGESRSRQGSSWKGKEIYGLYEGSVGFDEAVVRQA